MAAPAIDPGRRRERRWALRWRAPTLAAAAVAVLLLRVPTVPCVDFCTYWTAGALVREGRPAAAYDPAALAARHRAEHAGSRRLGGFLYSPLWLGPAAVIAALPAPVAEQVHRAAAAALLGLGLALVLARIREPGFAAAVAAAFALSHAAWALLVVQNWSFLLFAAIAGAWLAGARRRERVAGALWAAAVHLKVFALLVPAALVGGRRRRELGFALAAGVGLVAVSWVWADLDAWRRYLAFLDAASERGVTPYYNKVSLAASLARFTVDPRAWLAPREAVAAGLVRALLVLGLVALAGAAVRLRREPERLLAVAVPIALLCIPQIWDHVEVLLFVVLPALPRRIGWLLAALLAGTVLYNGAVQRLLERTFTGETPPVTLPILLLLYPLANLLALAGALAPSDAPSADA